MFKKICRIWSHDNISIQQLIVFFIGMVWVFVWFFWHGSVALKPKAQLDFLKKKKNHLESKASKNRFLWFWITHIVYIVVNRIEHTLNSSASTTSNMHRLNTIQWLVCAVNVHHECLTRSIQKSSNKQNKTLHFFRAILMFDGNSWNFHGAVWVSIESLL